MSKSKQKKSRTADNSFAPSRFKYPAISVIIPLYNAEKYIGECLDSILAQTFQNFEVIVVDDCSTDSSCAVVESYAEKFGGRLRLVHMNENSGGAGFPRNKGMELSCGEYMAFIDPDDTITPKAFEELYMTAKNFNADVVHCEKWYQLSDEFYNNAEHRKNLKPYSWPTMEKIFITQPTLLTDNLEKRAIDFSKQWLTWSVCLQLVRRDFILENEINFANVFAEDLLFTICEICCAERYVVIPNIFYLYRLRENSAVRETFDVNKLIQKHSSALKNGINYLDSFFNEHTLFFNKIDLKYTFFKMFVFLILGHLYKVYAQVPAHALDELLRKEFSDGDNTALITFIFSTMNIQRLQLIQAQQQTQKFNQFAAQAQRRIVELEAEVNRLKNKE